MGQYHYPVNLDRKEFVDPHKLGAGLKLWEQLAAHPGTSAALVVLLASASNGQGGGDLRTGGETVGLWRGNRIAFVGDYDDASRYVVGAGEAHLSGADIYGLCSGGTWTDVTEAVCAVLERELRGAFTGDGWRDFVLNEAT